MGGREWVVRCGERRERRDAWLANSFLVHALHVQAKEQGRVWLGQLVEGEWEIQHKSALPALQHVSMSCS